MIHPVGSRQYYLKTFDVLKRERNPWLEHWREIADYTGARRPRFLTKDRTKSRKNDKIINSTPLRYIRVFTAGMMAGTTNPSRIWFRTTLEDPDLAAYGPVKRWLHATETRIRSAFAMSNTYTSLQGVYDDLGRFGTSAMLMEEDDIDPLRTYNIPIGQFALANSPRLQANTLYRELSMTVIQMVEKFGYNAVSDQVRRMYDRGDYHEWVDILHVIEPNPNFTPGVIGPQGMKFKSVWLELDRADVVGFLRESGYSEFPLATPRWETTAEDPYGFSPAMAVLGDCKALQKFEKEKARMVEKTVTPPMKGPTSLLNRRISLLSGDFTPVDVGAGGATFEPAMSIPPLAFQAINEMIEVTEQRIGIGFYADLWQMLSESDRREITAREVVELHEEKMLQLGPALTRLDPELLDPLITRTYSILERKGLIPPPPPELDGVPIRIEFISILHQAQKLLGVNPIERASSYVMQVGQSRPDILDIINWDAAGREYGDAVGAPPNMYLDEDEVNRIRQQRAQQQQQERMAEMLERTSNSAQALSKAETGGSNLLDQLVRANRG